MTRRASIFTMPWLRRFVLGLAFGLAGQVVLAYGAELSVIIEPGIEQRRNYDRDDFWTRQWVRTLPPENSAHLLIVQGPDDWLASNLVPSGSQDVGSIGVEQAELLRAAMAEKGLLTRDQPLLAAGRIVAFLRPVELDGGRAPARRVRVWPLWELLAYSSHADTLSVSVAAVQTLERAGLAARVARYPASDGRFRFGVLVPASVGASAAGPWVYRAGPEYLVPVALSASPVADLQPDDFTAWNWQEVLASGWDPAGSEQGTLIEPPSPDPSQEVLGNLPDICLQARALNLECVEGDPGLGRERTLLTLSALILVILASWLVHSFRLRHQRLLRVRNQKDLRGEGVF